MTLREPFSALQGSTAVITGAARGIGLEIRPSAARPLEDGAGQCDEVRGILDGGWHVVWP